MVAEWSRAPVNTSREEGDVSSSPNPAKITFSDEIFLITADWPAVFSYFQPT